MKFIVAQCVGGLGIIVFLTCFHFKNMKNVLKIKLLADIIWGTHYFLMGAYSGFATNLVCCIRELIFMNNDKGLFKSKLWPWVFVIFNAVGAMFTWKGWYSIIPAMVFVFGTYSFWQKNVNVARKIAVTNNVCMFTYDVFVSSYMGMISEGLAFISVIMAIISNRRIEK